MINSSRLDGLVAPFEIIPFTNGRDPTVQGPVNCMLPLPRCDADSGSQQQQDTPLPALRSLNDVDALTVEELTRYLTGYGREVAQGVDAIQARRNMLEDAIGAVRRL